MLPLISFVLVAILGLHGLIHLLGFVAYWPLRAVPELAYKTTFLGGRLNLGTAGTRLYSVIWLLVAIGFVAACFGLVSGREWARPLLIAVTVASLFVIALDWAPAFRGAIVDVAILVLLIVGPQLANLISPG